MYKRQAEIWSTHDWVYALNNMMTEFYAPPQYGALSFSIDHASLGWFIYAPGGRFQHPGEVLAPLNDVYGAIINHLNCDFAFYTTPVTPLNKTEGLSSLLQDTKRNNVPVSYTHLDVYKRQDGDILHVAGVVVLGQGRHMVVQPAEQEFVV